MYIGEKFHCKINYSSNNFSHIDKNHSFNSGINLLTSQYMSLYTPRYDATCPLFYITHTLNLEYYRDDVMNLQ